MMSLVGEDIVNRLKSSNWKERLSAMEDLQSRTPDMKENLDASMLIQVITLWVPVDVEPLQRNGESPGLSNGHIMTSFQTGKATLVLHDISMHPY